MATELTPNHIWPGKDEHLWSKWMAKTGLPQATDYRVCLYPDCRASETRKSP